jgi:hypothetical protein
MNMTENASLWLSAFMIHWRNMIYLARVLVVLWSIWWAPVWGHTTVPSARTRSMLVIPPNRRIQRWRPSVWAGLSRTARPYRVFGFVKTTGDGREIPKPSILSSLSLKNRSPNLLESSILCRFRSFDLGILHIGMFLTLSIYYLKQSTVESLILDT